MTRMKTLHLQSLIWCVIDTGDGLRIDLNRGMQTLLGEICGGANRLIAVVELHLTQLPNTFVLMITAVFAVHLRDKQVKRTDNAGLAVISDIAGMLFGMWSFSSLGTKRVIWVAPLLYEQTLWMLTGMALGGSIAALLADLLSKLPCIYMKWQRLAP